MIKINRSKLRALSGICSNFSEVFFATLVIPVFSKKAVNIQFSMLLLGITATGIFSYLSLLFAEKGKL